MESQQLSIAIAGPAHVIRYGLTGIIRECLTGIGIRIIPLNDLQSIQSSFNHQHISVIIIDAAIIDANHKIIQTIKREHPDTALLAFQYQFLSSAAISQFDTVITIDQSDSEIASVIRNAVVKNQNFSPETRTETLSERETDVLKLLVTGLSGKEIADKLNISVNTVISHRKNISQKTGIKSLAGLTIYAVANKIISMSSLQMQ